MPASHTKIPRSVTPDHWLVPAPLYCTWSTSQDGTQLASIGLGTVLLCRRTSQPAMAEFSPSSSLGPCRRPCRHCPTLSGCAPVAATRTRFESRRLDARALPCGHNVLAGTSSATNCPGRCQRPSQRCESSHLCAPRARTRLCRGYCPRVAGGFAHTHASETAPASLGSQCRHE